MKSKLSIFILFFSLLMVQILFSQPQIRDFKMGIWGFFPWVEPNPSEDSLLYEINTNHIECWILNKNTNVYPAVYKSVYPDSIYDYSNIRWLEEVWFDYFDATQTTENPIGTYVGYNGFYPETGQSSSQIEWYASRLHISGEYANFLNILNTYVSQFSSRSSLDGYYVSHEDLRWNSRHNNVRSMLEEIRNADPDTAHERVIVDRITAKDSVSVPNFLTNNLDNFEVYEDFEYPFISGDDFQSSTHQTELDEVITYANQLMNIFQGQNSDWRAVIQTFADNSYRWPTREEMFAQAYLNLTRGARGIKTFLYGSTTSGLDGLLGVGFDATNSRSKTPVDYGSGTVYPFDFVKELFTELEIIKDVFPQIEVESAYTASAGTSGVFVTTTGSFIEAGVFHNRIMPDPDQKYVLLVNRVCNNTDGSPAASQAITATFPNRSPNSAYTIYDFREDKTYLFYSDATGSFEFDYILPPGEGRLFEVNKYSDSWSGALFVSNDLTVPTSKAVTILQGSVLNFNPGTDLFIDGSLDAQGTVSDPITLNTSSSEGYYWSGITILENGQGIFGNCSFQNCNFPIKVEEYAFTYVESSNFENCGFGIWFKEFSIGEVHSTSFINNSKGIFIERIEPIINSCSFSDCYEGIRFYHAYNPQNWNNEFVTGNTFQNCSMSMLLIDSSPYINNSQISNNFRGFWLVAQSEPVFAQNTFTSTENKAIYCASSSSPDMCSSNYYQKGGYNIIQNNDDVGILAASGSFPVLGVWPWNGGYNTILNNGGYEVYNANSTEIRAEYNWWCSGSGPPKGEIYGPVDWYPPLFSQPSKGQSGSEPQVNDDPSFLPEELDKAYADQMSGNCESAAKMFKDYFINNPDDKFSQRACVEYAKSCDCYLKSAEILIEFDNTRKQIKNDELLFTLSEAKITVLSRSSMFKEAMDEIDNLCKSDLSTDEENRMRIQKAYMYIYDLDEPEKGRICLEEVLSKSSTGDENNELASYELGLFENSKQQSLAKNAFVSEIQIVPENFEILSAYPNPFNPSTTFRFSSPWQGKIKIEIYNALGQRVRMFDHIKFSTGYNEVLWDGKNGQGSAITSGLYLIRYLAESTSNVKDRFQGYSKVIFLK